jgi:hypothetical protein
MSLALAAARTGIAPTGECRSLRRCSFHGHDNIAGQKQRSWARSALGSRPLVHNWKLINPWPPARPRMCFTREWGLPRSGHVGTAFR